MKKIVTILGARPQFIKAAVLSRIIKGYNECEEVIIHTGQHFDANMSTVFFEEMQIPKPKYNLGIHSLGHGVMTGKMMEALEPILLDEQPDVVVVYGDTNSTLAGALVAKKLHIKLVHIEAGLRSFNMEMPEEVNRILTDRISDLLCCPTQKAMDNLEQEGFTNFESRCILSGDIMKDAVEYFGEQASKRSTILKDLSLEKYTFILCTIHRQENTINLAKLKSIMVGLNEIGNSCKVVLPLHPRTKKILMTNEIHPENIHMLEPVGYFDMLELLNNCKMVITDSGGLQKEAFFSKKHCIVLREETEWVELIDHGFAVTVGSNTDELNRAYKAFETKRSDFSLELYGNEVGEKIYKEIVKLIH